MAALTSLPVPLLAAALAFFANSSALAAEFTWNAPRGCPDRDALRWRIEEALGTTLANAAPLVFSAKVEENPPRHWEVALDVSSSANQTEPQHRKLQASNCDELAQAVSVAIALALGADQAEPKEIPSETTKSGAPEAKETAPEPAKPVDKKLSRAVTPKKDPESRSSYWGAADLGPTLDLGSLPGLAPGIEIVGLLGKGAIGIKLGGLVLPSHKTEVSGSLGGAFTLLAASATACGVSAHPSVILRLCAGSEIGKLSGKGLNTTHSWTGSSGWLAPRIDLQASWSLLDESLRLFGSGTLAMPLIRKEFLVTGLPGRVHQPESVIGRLGAGLELIWQ
jgi:hypothetical protein